MRIPHATSMARAKGLQYQRYRQAGRAIPTAAAELLCKNRTEFDLDSPQKTARNSPAGNWEGFMHEYEIRVLSAGRTVLITSQIQLSDHAAIRSGRKMAADKPFEVWRGL